MRKAMSMLLFFVTLHVLGCSTLVKYDLKNDVYEGKGEPIYNVISNPVVDKRETTERPPTDGLYYSSDSMFTGRVMPQITDMLALHLQRMSPVRIVTVETVDVQSAAVRQHLYEGGYAAFVSADLTTFYGYQGNFMPGFDSGGAAPVVVDMVANKKDVGGEVVYSNVKIRSLPSGDILWEGDISYDFKDRETFYKGSVGYAIRALKGANNKFAQILDCTLQGAQADGQEVIPGRLE